MRIARALLASLSLLSATSAFATGARAPGPATAKFDVLSTTAPKGTTSTFSALKPVKVRDIASFDRDYSTYNVKLRDGTKLEVTRMTVKLPGAGADGKAAKVDFQPGDSTEPKSADGIVGAALKVTDFWAYQNNLRAKSGLPPIKH